MDKLTMLGTGHAMTTECFNTCFVYENEQGKMLIDTGGGQQLLVQLRNAHINVEDISCVFLTHRHTDHLLGLPWLLRMRMRTLTSLPLEIITHSELCKTVENLLTLLFPELITHFGTDLLITPVEHAEKLSLLGRDFQFYDTAWDTCTQFGFALMLADGSKFVFNGDVPYNESNKEMMKDAKWLMHEAFCLQSEQQHKMKKHSSVALAAKYAEGLNARRLILVHGSDSEINVRKTKYTEEASTHFNGKIYVPDDLDQIVL